MSQSREDTGATRALRSRDKEVVFQRFRVTVVAGPDQGRAHDGGPELSIGSGEGNDLTLGDQTVSRHHCAIGATARGWLLRDLGSTNGTQVGGFRVESIYLKAGAVIEIGNTRLRFETLEEEIHEPLSDEDRFGRILGRSPAMRRIFALLPRIAGAESTVLLEGETGTGKGLLADAIHQASPRARGPFIVVDCSSIPPTLIESELFGHEKGAFTGAHTARTGAFEAARGGTVFLDEVGELPLDMQPKLLRALEERTIKRIGGQEPVKLNVRVVAATNRDLRQEVNRGAFRSDLFYRLNIVKLRVPPLRERRDDIALLIAHFYEQFATSGDAPPAELVADLMRADWPGNVRELRSAVERVVLLDDPALWQEISPSPTESGAPEPAAAAVAFDPELSFRAAKERAVARWEREFVRELIRRSGGNLSRAARAGRMDRNHLRELLRRHDVPVHDD